MIQTYRNRCLVAICIMGVIFMISSISVHASSLQDIQNFDFSQLESILSETENVQDFSFEQLLNLVIEGDFEEIGRVFKDMIINCLLTSIKENQTGLRKILLLTIFLAVYSIFASAFSNHTISESGFYVTYLVLVVLLSRSFEITWQTAMNLIRHLFEFSTALLPTFLLAVAYSGNQAAAVGYYQITAVVLSAVEWLFFKVFMPAIRIYFILSILNELSKEGYFSSLLQLLGKGIRNAQKYVMTAMTGLQLIQGLILPQLDTVKNQTLVKAVSAIPGLGGATQALSSTVLGAGILIRNGIGVTAIICLGIFCITPFLQMSVISFLYHISSAIIAPIADKRVTKCINKTAEGIDLLIKVITSSLIIFIILIAGICLTTKNGG